jgi:hypothetical protein
MAVASTLFVYLSYSKSGFCCVMGIIMVDSLACVSVLFEKFCSMCNVNS